MRKAARRTPNQSVTLPAIWEMLLVERADSADDRTRTPWWRWLWRLQTTVNNLTCSPMSSVRPLESVFVSRPDVTQAEADQALAAAINGSLRLDSRDVQTDPPRAHGQQVPPERLRWAVLIDRPPGFGDASGEFVSRGRYAKSAAKWPLRWANFIRSWDLREALFDALDLSETDPQTALAKVDQLRAEAAAIGMSRLPLLDGRTLRRIRKAVDAKAQA